MVPTIVGIRTILSEQSLRFIFKLQLIIASANLKSIIFGLNDVAVYLKVLELIKKLFFR